MSMAKRPTLRTVPGRLRPAPSRLSSASTAKDRQARREYPTNCAAWREIREAQLCREPLCRECTKAGRVTAATVCDHVDGNANNNPADGSNYQSLCKTCHSAKTAREDGGFGNVRSQTARGEVGPLG
jgi:5-methylcytosine-specific restriction protein A